MRTGRLLIIISFILTFIILENVKNLVSHDNGKSMYKVNCREFAIMSGRLYNTIIPGTHDMYIS
jgi:site-specific DNA-cytosine methylase